MRKNKYKKSNFKKNSLRNNYFSKKSLSSFSDMIPFLNKSLKMSSEVMHFKSYLSK